MNIENGLVPISRGVEAAADITWSQFIGRAGVLGDKLQRLYDELPIERREYYRDVCRGGFNFGKTVGWVVDYSPNPQALESIAQALEAIANWPNAGSMAWETRRFIKGSSTHGYNNVPDIVKFGELIKKIGNDDPTNGKGFQIDMDFFYWDSGWGVDGESSEEEILRGHVVNVAGVLDGLERYAHPEIIELKRNPTKEEIEAKEKEEVEQYWRDFLADAKSHYSRQSVFDLLDQADLINRPYHKILTYPVECCDVLASSVWNPNGYTDVHDAVTAFYRAMPYMTVKRADNAWFPSPLPADYVYSFDMQLERRLKGTLAQKPWLIDFSVKWQDVLQRSFVGGNHQTNHAGEVELVYKNPRYNPESWFSDEYTYRHLESEEEKLFFESVTDIQSLTDSQTPVKPPKQISVFNGQTGTPYLFKLADGRSFNIFLKHEYGSINWEGKVVIITPDGPELLFKDREEQLTERNS